MTDRPGPVRPFGRLLVANRGEIALRVVRACRDAGLHSLAVYADGDAGAPYVEAASESLALGGITAAETYLDAAKVLAAAVELSADAVHPGYGFLAEDADFAAAVIDAGLVWIGPPPAVIRLLGDKVAARRLASSVGVATVAGSPEPVDEAGVEAFAAAHGLPVVIKAAHGGGGRGLRVVRRVADIPALWSTAVGEATAAFGRPECFVERFVERARHVEVQLLGDTHGAVVVVGDRDCTVQRRHQKLIEEAPAPFLEDTRRATLHEAALAIGRAAGYVGAGTIEFLLDPAGELSFLEVNCRLQVEHPVTEEVSGLDLVRAQLAIAAGGRVPSGSGPPAASSRHALELRLTAEHPTRGFAPSTGTLRVFRMPSGPGVRVDAGVHPGAIVGAEFDSLLAKIVVSGADREDALARARRALDETVVEGVATSLPFLRAVVGHEAFTGRDGAPMTVHTGWVEATPAVELGAERADDAGGGDVMVEVLIGGRWLAVAVPGLATVAPDVFDAARRARAAAHGAAVAGDAVVVPMQATLVALHVADGDEVGEGDPVAVVEAMKMQHLLIAPNGGRVTGLGVDVGASVAGGIVLCRIVA